ncbi:MAG TPA: hypothetical protein VFR05_10825, partial [Terriglobia bacterium]|nr:hypothetical protein [Terriglobia bacterium]
MKYGQYWIQRSLAIFTAFTLVLSPVGPAFAVPAQTKTTTTTTTTTTTRTTPAQTTTTAPATAPANTQSAANAAAAAAAQAVDGGWPRLYPAASGATIILYQPQIASWKEQKELELYSAVAYTPKGGKRTLGTIKALADTRVSIAERLVEYNLRVTDVHFPELEKKQVQEITTEIGTAVKSGVIALDRILSGIDQSQIIPKNVEGVKADPPEVFFSKKPAILVNLDGPVIWSPIQGTDLQYAINTNWDLFHHVPS